jgi:hypothetical protein
MSASPSIATVACSVTTAPADFAATRNATRMPSPAAAPRPISEMASRRDVQTPAFAPCIGPPRVSSNVREGRRDEQAMCEPDRPTAAASPTGPGSHDGARHRCRCAIPPGRRRHCLRRWRHRAGPAPGRHRSAVNSTSSSGVAGRLRCVEQCCPRTRQTRFGS